LFAGKETPLIARKVFICYLESNFRTMNIHKLLTIGFVIAIISGIIYVMVMDYNKKNKESLECGMYDEWCIEYECDDVGVFEMMCGITYHSMII
jgi:hypothetical protein